MISFRRELTKIVSVKQASIKAMENKRETNREMSQDEAAVMIQKGIQP